MSILPHRRQKSLFSWEDCENLGDLERLKLALGHMPDEALMQDLEAERGLRGRDDYPVRAVWNSLIAQIVFGHESIASLRRELSRNAQLRWMCGFEGYRVPSAAAYTRFMIKLIDRTAQIVGVFDTLVAELFEELDSSEGKMLGAALGIDAKFIQAHARATKKALDPDGRRDLDADYGVKTRHRKDGTKDKVLQYGYQVHLVADTTYELPVGFEVTTASVAEQPIAHQLMGRLSRTHPGIVSCCEVLTADRGYDTRPFLMELWEKHQIKGVIDIRNTWRDEPEETRLLGDWDNVVQDWQGRVYCFCPRTQTQRQMVPGGFEKDRATVKYRCPAWQYSSIECAGRNQCQVKSCFRVKIAEDPRRFTAIPRGTDRWKDLYAQRTAVERINSRLDVSFGFERHYIRGLARMKVRVGMALSVMLAMALGQIRNNKPDRMRSLVGAA